ncbi:MAG: ComF family protein [Spirochaetales bacterium]
MNRVALTLIDLLFPESCILCGKWILDRVGDYPLCPSCKKTLQVLKGRRCQICSTVLTSQQETCLECRSITFAFQQNLSFGLYRGALKEILLAYKSRGIQRLKGLFAELVYELWKTAYEGLPIVPVPSRPESVKERGFDPMREICKDLQKKYQLDIRYILSRHKGTCQQKVLGKEERRANLKNAYFLSQPTVKSFPFLKKVVLLDDVFTTGATLHACSEILKMAGTEQIYGLTLARD